MIFYDSRYEINRICIEVTRQALDKPLHAQLIEDARNMRVFVGVPGNLQEKKIATYEKVRASLPMPIMRDYLRTQDGGLLNVPGPFTSGDATWNGKPLDTVGDNFNYNSLAIPNIEGTPATFPTACQDIQ